MPFAPEVSAARTTDWVEVPWHRPTRSGGPFFFHPSLPLVGQARDDGECGVWDMDLLVYRGAIELAVCQAWEPPPRPVSPSLVAQLLGLTGAPASAEPPRAPAGPASAAGPGPGASVAVRPGPAASATLRPSPEVPGSAAVSRPPAAIAPHTVPTDLVSAWHPDERRLALGQRHGHQVKIWDTRTQALLRTIELPAEPPDSLGYTDSPELRALAWTPSGDLAVAGVPFGAAIWSAREPGAPLAPLSRRPFHDVLSEPLDDLWLDPRGRYLGYTSFNGGTQGNYVEGAGVRSLTDETKIIEDRIIHEGSADSPTHPPVARPLGWSPTGEVAFGVYRPSPDPMDPGLRRGAIAVFDARHHRADWSPSYLGQHVDLAPSPDGSSAIWVERTMEGPEKPGERPASTTTMRLWRWFRDRYSVAWSVKAKPDAIAWAPGSKDIATVSGGQVTVHSVADGKVRKRWAGDGPLSWSPAGDRLAFTDAAGAMVVHSFDADPPLVRMNGARAVTWTREGLLALATDEAVTLLDARSWQPVHRFVLPGVTRLWFDDARKRVLLLDRQHTLHVGDDVHVERLASFATEPTVHLTPAGEVLVVEPTRLRRFTHAASGWSEQPSVRLREEESVDPEGRVAVTLQERLTRMRRLSDGETLNFDGKVTWTDRHAYETLPDPAQAPWVFRRGDVLTGRVVQGAEAAALAPRVPDLWSAFWSGKALPGL